MDRIIFFLIICLFANPVFSEGTDWSGRPEVLQDQWRGDVRIGNKKPFGTILDDGADNGKISLVIDPVYDNRLVGYRLHYGTESGTYTSTHDCKKTLETWCTVSGLTNDTTYYFVAVAYGLNPDITSEYSDEVSGAP